MLRARDLCTLKNDLVTFNTFVVGKKLFWRAKSFRFYGWIVLSSPITVLAVLYVSWCSSIEKSHCRGFMNRLSAGLTKGDTATN